MRLGSLMKLNNMSIGSRLSVAFGVLATLVLAAALAGGWGMRAIAKISATTIDGDLKVAQLAAEMEADMLRLRRFEKDVFINISARDKVASYHEKWDRVLQETEAAHAAIHTLAPERYADEMTELREQLSAYATGFRETIALIQAGTVATTASANESMSRHKAAIYRTEELVEKIGADSKHRAAGASDSIHAREAQVMNALVFLTVASLLLAAGLALVITRGITRPLRSAVRLANAVASGELGHETGQQRGDEVGDLLRALHEMDRQLADIIGEVRTGSDVVRSIAAELAQNNDHMSQRTQEQASALEQTAASLEEMTASVRGNASGANRANQLVQGAQDVATAGGEVVTRAVRAMSEIHESSRRIADIITVIDEIAFQTNLLALNAAVEAARAGEQGRGFAVVATEVRNLAQRSAAAAREIKSLISDSVDKVRMGSDLVSQSGEHLQRIVESVRRVTEVVGAIASASSEQATAVTQLNDAVTQLDAMTQQNAASIEEIAASSKMMQHQSEALAHKAAYFKDACSAAGRRGTVVAEEMMPRDSSALAATEHAAPQHRYGT